MAKYKVEDIIKCSVCGITEYGFFVNIDKEYVGLCHISEVWNDFVKDINDFVHNGEIIYCQIIEIDEHNKKMKLSIKNIYFKTEEDGNRIVESRKGFLPLKNMLPKWIEAKLLEYTKNKKN